ncbi:nucleotide-binding protein [Candidatus Woesearchaeota archaeon]|nr:nucleotide-binding protein [Candidatus Woesearchaeota archaeon]
MKQIILDTNFLLIPIQFKVDIFSEIDRLISEPYKLCIIDSTLDELNKIKETASGKDKNAANLAIQLLKAKNVHTITTSKDKNVDNLIVELAESPEYLVATQDKELKQRLKANKIKIIILKQKKYLEIT